MDNAKQQLLIENYDYIKNDIVRILSKKYFSIDVEEIESVALLTAVEATVLYNSDKLCYKNYIKMCVERRLIDIIKSKKHKLELLKDITEINIINTNNFENDVINKNMVKDLLNSNITQTQKNIIAAILKNPNQSNNKVAKSLNMYNVQLERELKKLKKYV